nr:MAG TPA: hypothetical protein [Caudoviricetes sp.]DAX20350.1 MAG TPA: hypothetical protein [Caudoviricetes sp.]
MILSRVIKEFGFIITCLLLYLHFRYLYNC